MILQMREISALAAIDTLVQRSLTLIQASVIPPNQEQLLSFFPTRQIPSPFHPKSQHFKGYATKNSRKSSDPFGPDNRIALRTG
jgi:hypothetical protein